MKGRSAAWTGHQCGINAMVINRAGVCRAEYVENRREKPFAGGCSEFMIFSRLSRRTQ
jgi:hypothetical protein